jgi:hypothetical protein
MVGFQWKILLKMDDFRGVSLFQETFISTQFYTLRIIRYRSKDWQFFNHRLANPCSSRHSSGSTGVDPSP